jgi:hypothetical protein
MTPRRAAVCSIHMTSNGDRPTVIGSRVVDLGRTSKSVSLRALCRPGRTACYRPRVSAHLAQSDLLFITHTPGTWWNRGRPTVAR